MILRIDADQPLPVYEQIRAQVTRMVVAGTLEVGTRMPTIRQLANDLHLARGTVAKAYALLEQAAIVESRGHKGTFVAARPSEVVPDTDAIGEAAKSFVVSAKQLGVDLDGALEQVRKHWIGD